MGKDRVDWEMIVRIKGLGKDWKNCILLSYIVRYVSMEVGEGKARPILHTLSTSHE